MNELNQNSIIIDDTEYQTRLTKKFLSRKKYVPKSKSQIVAFIPGTIRAVTVKNGQRIKKGDSLLILEAMKMKNEIKAEFDATVKNVLVKENQLVAKNELLIELT
jgi:biotin carboxyl carrier protein